MHNKAEQIVIKNWGNWIMIEIKEILDKLKFVIRSNTGLFSCSKYLPFLASNIGRTKIESYTSKSFEAPGKDATCAMVPLLHNVRQ